MTPISKSNVSASTIKSRSHAGDASTVIHNDDVSDIGGLNEKKASVATPLVESLTVDTNMDYEDAHESRSINVDYMDEGHLGVSPMNTLPSTNILLDPLVQDNQCEPDAQHLQYPNVHPTK